MHKSTRNILIAVVVLLVIVAIAYWWWVTKDTAKLAVSQVAAASGSGTGPYALTLSVTYGGKMNPSTWVGKTAHLYAKGLGKAKAPVTAVSLTSGAGTVAIGPVTFAAAPTLPYTAMAGDYVRIYMKY